MEWIVKIEGEFEKNQRLRITFDPLAEKINFYGEVKTKNTANGNEWSVFSWFIFNGLEIKLDEIQKKMEDCVVAMRRRHKEYLNLSEGFEVLKQIGFEEEESTDDDSQLI